MFEKSNRKQGFKSNLRDGDIILKWDKCSLRES